MPNQQAILTTPRSAYLPALLVLMVVAIFPTMAQSAAPVQRAKLSGAAPPHSLVRFVWPAKGRVILSFCFCASDQNGRRSAINIVVIAGSPVRAAADGYVAYAGNDLKPYHNLILIRHVDGWVTAYAGASRLLVRRGDHVSRGQLIAFFNRLATGKPPVLHFEMRKGDKIVDPLNYLPVQRP